MEIHCVSFGACKCRFETTDNWSLYSHFAFGLQLNIISWSCQVGFCSMSAGIKVDELRESETKKENPEPNHIN